MPAVRADRLPFLRPLLVRSRAALAALTLAVLLVAVACAPSVPAPVTPGPVASSSTTSGPRATQLTVDGWVAAARAADRAAFDAGTSARDPSFVARARLLYTNLATLPLASVRVVLRPERAQLTTPRRVLLGGDAWVQAATVSWRLVGEDAPAEHTVWLTFVADADAIRLAGTVDGPAGRRDPVPVWWTGPVSARTAGTATVLVGSGQPAATWATRAAAAVDDVRRRLRGGAAAGWSGSLVVEVPATRRDVEAVVGMAPGRSAGLAAVTLDAGPGEAAVRVVVNPEATSALAPLGVAVVLAHETVHVATGSTGSPAPSWLVEGLADEVALAAHPAAVPAVVAPLLRRVRAAGPPPALPGEGELAADADDVDVGYAAAWSACRYVADTWSAADLQRLYAAVDDGEPLAAAVPDVLGVTVDDLADGWRASLVRRAEG